MADDFDMTAHRETWGHFTKLTNYGIVGVVALLILMALFLL
jgi:hypothetical protein